MQITLEYWGLRTKTPRCDVISLHDATSCASVVLSQKIIYFHFQAAMTVEDHNDEHG
jgi:hypothetical protein